MKNLMPLSEGKLMVKTYLENKSKVLPSDLTLPNTETFDSDAFVELLNLPDCVKIRLYYGMNEKLEICAIILGVDSNGNEITIKDAGISSSSNNEDEFVIEISTKCPPTCDEGNNETNKKLL
jgi:hypothetical protein